MKFKHALLATVISSGFILPAAAHEITFALGGLGASLNTQQEFVDSSIGSSGTIQSSGTANTLGGEAAIAYVWNVNSGFDIGFEFFYDFVNNMQVQSTLGETTTINNLWGGRALPAFHITNNTKLYLNLGYAIIDQTIDVSNVAGIDLLGFKSTSAKSQNQGGFQYGAGLETMIYNTIGIRVAYTAQQSDAFSITNDTGDITFNSTPTVYEFFFGATYHFQF